MITYTQTEIKKAIRKTVPIGTIITKEDLTNLKWTLILNNGFDKKGWLKEEAILTALGSLCNGKFFEKHRDAETQQRFYVRVA